MIKSYEVISMRYPQFFVTAAPGTKVSAFDFGGTGPVLLICPANGFHGLCYAEMAKHLAHKFHCYGVDLRGQGDSTLQVSEETLEAAVSEDFAKFLVPAKDIPTIEGFVEDIRAVLDHLGCTECYLFGHSGGGCAAVAAAVRLGPRVRSVYGFEPVMMSPEELRSTEREMTVASNNLYVMARKRRWHYASKQAAYDNLRTKAFSKFHPAVLRDYIDHGLSDRPGGGCELKCGRNCEALLYLTVERMSAVYFQALPHLRCAVTLAIGCQHSEGINVSARAKTIAAHLPNATLETHEALDHFGPMVDPQYVAQRVLAAFEQPSAKL